MNFWLFARVTVLAAAYVLGLQTVHAQTNEPAAAVKEVPVAANSFSLGEPIPSWVDRATVPQLPSTQPVVVRVADTQFFVGATPTVYVHRALTINNAASLNGAGQIPISFAPDYQRLQLHAVSIIRGSEKQDRTTSATIRFLQREAGLEQGVYSGFVTASILISDLRVGDTIEYAYSVQGQNPVFGGRFFNWASWDQPYPTDYRRIILNYPVERRISWRLIASGQFAPVLPQESTNAGVRKLVFEERGAEATPAEPLTPPDYAALRWLQFSEYADWKEVAAWGNDLFQAPNGLDDDLRKVVEKLRLLPSNEERAAAALEFVQSEIRYFSLSLGESSHRPAPPDVVLKRRYGDCKDKSLLLLTLLRELGIPSKVVLLQIGRRRGLENTLPSPQLFDHVIVQATVDGTVFYFDPTRLGQHGRLSRMGQAHEGAQILLIGPDTAGPSSLTANAPETFLSDLSETAKLATLDGEAELEVRQIWSGLLAEQTRVLLERLPRDQIVKAVGDTMERKYPGAKLVGDPQIEDDRINNVISTIAVYRVPHFAIERQGFWVVRYMPSNMMGALPMPSSAARRDPLYAGGFPYRAKYSFEAKLPEDVSMMADPSGKSFENKYFSYAVASSFRGSRAKTDLELKLLADRIEASDVPAYAADMQEAGNAVTGAIVIPKDAVKSAEATAAKSADLPQRLRNRVQESIEKTTATINSGKLTGNDLADAYCNRAAYYSDLERTDEALQDINHALKIAPDSSSLLACRGEIYFQAGQFEKSVNDYSRAISLGRTDSRTFYLRGISKFYADKMEEAATDFNRASETEDQDAQMYSDLWLTWTLRRLGRPLPDAVIKRAALRPRGEWPRPALAMLTGNITPDEMLKIVDEKSGDDRHMTLAEGYFYLGEHYLAEGKNAQAVEYFEKTRDLQVTMYIEHRAAKFELLRQKNNH
jgi:lipoprotein NlpI/transglutaminase-like putative cysteine protease